MAVRTRERRYRTAATVAASFLIVSMSLAGCSSSGIPSACAGGLHTTAGSSGLHRSKSVSSSTLPPSHDNDAGEGRIPDRTADADVDANQKPQRCS